MLTGDRVLTIDDVPVRRSPRLDWRTDDAYLPDPPVHALLCEEGDEIVLEVEHAPGEPVRITIESSDYTAFDAAEASAKVFERDGFSIAYVHFWFIHITGNDELLKELMIGEFAGADALVLDLRGRGGSASMVARITALLKAWREKTNRPLIVIIDSMTRSAKEVIAYQIRTRWIGTLVGERTAGAVLPAGFFPVSDDAVLMLPFTRLGKFSDKIEGVGVEPHVHAAPSGPYSAGRDALIEAALDEAVKQIRADEVDADAAEEIEFAMRH